MWMVGLVAILAGAYLLYFEAGLDRWVSIGILGAGVLVFVGLAVMTFATNSPRDPAPRTVVREEAAPATVVERAPRHVVERDDRNR
jgi:hypothetical protein